MAAPDSKSASAAAEHVRLRSVAIEDDASYRAVSGAQEVLALVSSCTGSTSVRLRVDVAGQNRSAVGRVGFFGSIFTILQDATGVIASFADLRLAAARSHSLTAKAIICTAFARVDRPSRASICHQRDAIVA